ncbi:hypothetical protein BDV97DRAFT_25620 [Delphinella strobiligena]|nr:hypothetical protein BDV97DRAFT_25620 [Delphinella strobiligena]
MTTETLMTVNNTILPRQCTVPYTTSVKQTQVAQSGTWCDVWATDSGCEYCSLSSGQCVRAITWSNTTEASFTIGFDTSSEGDVLDLIKASGHLNVGYKWDTSYTKGGS